MQEYTKKVANRTELETSSFKGTRPFPASGISNQALLSMMQPISIKKSPEEEHGVISDALRARFEPGFTSHSALTQVSALQNVDVRKGHRLEMDSELRQDLESKSGYDLSNIQLWESQQASDMGAKAFAKGNTIHFAPGQYQPNNEDGKSVIAHEVGHVIQQAKRQVQADSNFINVNTSDRLENDADTFGTRISGMEEASSFQGSLTPLPTMDSSTAPVQGMFGNIGKILKKLGRKVRGLFHRNQQPAPAHYASTIPEAEAMQAAMQPTHYASTIPEAEAMQAAMQPAHYASTIPEAEAMQAAMQPAHYASTIPEAEAMQAAMQPAHYASTIPEAEAMQAAANRRKPLPPLPKRR